MTVIRDNDRLILKIMITINIKIYNSNKINSNNPRQIALIYGTAEL